MWIVNARYYKAKAGRPDSYRFKDEDLSALIRWMERNRISEKAHVTLKRVPTWRPKYDDRWGDISA